jgi:NAD(P)-dependent dehydrogenase (short-subunit alcohol dehydrogenase family)
MVVPERTALITGAAGALGGVIAHRFAENGAHLALPVRTAEQQGALAASFALPPGRLFVGVAELTDDTSVRRFVEAAVSKFRSVDYLVNTAGGYAGGRLIEDVGVDEWDKLLNTNLKTVFIMCSAVLPQMRQQRFGRIINIAAMAALIPGARRGPYQVSKRGVITLTETIAEETRGTGITANAIAPSTILTSANKQSMPDADTSRWVLPEDIAGLVLHLCSDEARSVTGTTVRM